MAPEQPARSGIDFSAFRDPKLARELIERIHELAGDRAINLMEVCGTHTVSIGRYGFRSIMPAGLKLLSGPGCPVCVTANRDIDHAIALANIDGAIITTFGDMMRVPGSSTSLAAQKAAGRDIRIVYSPLDALDIAEQNPDRPVIFMGVGFETTTPTIAAAILEAEARGCRCGDVLRGAITPSSCPLFGHACTPEHPVGPCMVSSEGSCAAYFRYRG